MKDKELPTTDSIQELANFWDTHDLTDFEEKLEEVTEPVFKCEAIMRIHLQPDEVKAVKELARSKGISHNDLLHDWIVERIHASRFSISS